MEITKTYTRTMHKNIRSALEIGTSYNLILYNSFIKRIFITNIRNKIGVIIRYNTALPTHSGLTKEGFLKKSYEEIIAELLLIYEKCITDNTFQLKGYKHEA